MGEFSDKVFEAVRRVPRGKVATYGQIARMIGSPRSARYVGYALRANPAPGIDPASIPCHRIVFKDGRLTDGYAFGGPGEQRRLLEEEGVLLADDKRVDMDACQWDGRPPESAGPSDAAGSAASGGEGGTPGRDECGASQAAFPTAPPDGFDWARELGD